LICRGKAQKGRARQAAIKKFFYFFNLYLALAAFSGLDLPLLVKVPRRDFGGLFGRPARAACAS
jgi:hypothetical protein